MSCRRFVSLAISTAYTSAPAASADARVAHPCEQYQLALMDHFGLCVVHKCLSGRQSCRHRVPNNDGLGGVEFQEDMGCKYARYTRSQVRRFRKTSSAQHAAGCSTGQAVSLCRTTAPGKE